MTRALADMLAEVERPAWMQQAACAGATDLFFPGIGDSFSARRARRICDVCCVRLQCLEYAVDHRIAFGVWGGTTPKERRAIVRLRGGS